MHLLNRLSKKKATWEINVYPPSSIYPPCILWILNLRHEEKFIQFFFFFKSWVIKTELLKAALLKAFSLLSSLENPVYLQCLSLQSLCYLPSLSDFLAVSMSLSGSLLPAPLSSMLKQSMWTVSSLWFLLNASSSWYWSFKVFLLNSCF